MIDPGRRSVSVAAVQIATYCVGLVGFAIYTRASLDNFAESYRTTFTYWEAVLEVIGSVYVICYWIIPIAVWVILHRLQGNALPENLIRYATRTDWALAQGVRTLPWVAVLVGGLLVVALIAGAGYPFTWAWGPSSGDADVLLQLPGIARLQPLPVLSVGLQVIALSATLVALTVVIAATASNLERPHAATVIAVALILWSIVSFRTDGWFSDIFGVVTYALPVKAAQVLPFGPGGGVMVLLVTGALMYASARRLELYRPRRNAVPAPLVMVTLGMATLAALASTLPGDERQPRMLTLMLLQGSGTDGVSLLHFLASVLLTLVPAILMHRDLVSSLSGRRYAEMIRLPSPAHWYGRRLSAAVVICIGYGLAMATWATLLVTVRLRTLPDADSLLLAGLWGLALSAQTLVVTVMLALGTIAARRVEGGAYAVGGALILSWPLGAVSRWTPTGQASLVRMTDPWGPNPAAVSPLPLIVLLAWAVVLGAATAVLFNRTRGEVL